MEKERIEKERIEKERIEKEKSENERKEKERLEKERIEKEKEKEKARNELLKKENMELDKKKNEYIKLKELYEQNKENIFNFTNNLQLQENLIDNYKLFINEFSSSINDLNIKNNISIVCIDYNEKTDPSNNQQFYDKINIISQKLNKFEYIINNIKNNKLKKVERKYILIQNDLNEIDLAIKSNDPNLKLLLSINNGLIQKNLDELNSFIQQLKKDENTYEKIKTEIEKDIKELQEEGKKLTEEIQNTKKIIKEKENIEKNNLKISNIFLKNSMLLGINEFSNPNEIFSSRLIFKKENNKDYYEPQLIEKNWKEICYVYEDYDLHEVNFVLQAVGLNENRYFPKSSFGFPIDTLIEVIEFEIDGKNSDYNYENSLLKYDINLKNMETNKIYIKYKESPNNLSEEEKKGRNLYRSDYYGLSKSLNGQKAIFTLIIKCDYEIINFEKGYFTKIKEGEYKWGGTVPPEGKKILVSMSRKTAKFEFNIKQTIESIDKTPLKETTLRIRPFSNEGNNEIKNSNCYSSQTDQIKYDAEKNQYEIKFINTNSYVGEFVIKGELINRCKGEWKCDLTEEEIEKDIPEDYMYNKEKFKEIALNIINEYDKTHGYDLIKVTDFVKIGEWVKENIKYDIRYKGKNEIPATDIYKNRVGVCHHYTILYNALMYSLGYQCIYVGGYAIKKNNCFNEDDGHAWSLIKVNDKWLPFDATWGIFSGKLPVTHIFEYFFRGKRHASGIDNIKFGERKVKGNFSEIL